MEPPALSVPVDGVLPEDADDEEGAREGLAPEQVVATYLASYDALCAEIRSLQSSRERIMALGVSLLSVAFGIGLRDGISGFLILSPIGVFTLAFYVLSMYTDIMAMGGYKRHLEERVNALAGQRVLYWEAISEGINRRLNLNLPILVGLFGVILAVVGYFAVAEVRVVAGAGWAWGYAAFLLGLLALAGRSVLVAKNVFRAAYEAAASEEDPFMPTPTPEPAPARG